MSENKNSKEFPGKKLKKTRLRLQIFTPLQSLLVGFVLVILVGLFLLSLPIATTQPAFPSLIDNFFTVTSAITTTGLIVVDTGSYYSRFGQVVILALFQIGGLGYMIFVALIILASGRRLSLYSRAVLRESLGRWNIDTLKFIKKIVIFTLFFEILGTAGLAFYLSRYYGLGQAVYSAVFHSVSAFCTAGFSLYQTSFTTHHSSLFINIFLPVIYIAGSLGFFVLDNLLTLFCKVIKGKRPRGLSVHSKFVLLLTSLLISSGVLVILFSEMGFNFSNLGDKIFASCFQSMTAQTTTGFNTVKIGMMSTTSLLFIILLMFIGGSPGGTAGGIKTTTFGVLMLANLRFLRNKKNTNLLGGRIPPDIINRAFAVAFASVLLVVLGVMILSITERFGFLEILFEVVSAFGTVGLSTGITPSLSVFGKIVVSIIMFVGRVGPLAIGFSLLSTSAKEAVRYPEIDVLVG